MGRTFSVSVSKDYLVFASAHFITFSGHQCEALHGHNYRVGISVEGPVDAECMFVLDFGILKSITRALVDEIDHKVLLPTKNPKLAYAEAGEQVSVAYFGKPTYAFPKSDCAFLPIPNTTAEMLAEYLAGRVKAELRERGFDHLSRLALEVEESFGQSATYAEDMP